MKTREPLQGLIMATNHEIIHLALVFAQLTCMYYYNSHAWPFDTNITQSAFLITHSWCFISKMISYALEHKKYYEWSKIFEISYVPLYIYIIFEAHFYELNSMIQHTESCDDGHLINLLYQWYIIELRVFYGYILSGVVFIMMC